MDVTREDRDADVVLAGEFLKLEDEVVAFVFMGSSAVVIVKIVGKIGFAVEFIEYRVGNSEMFVEEANGFEDGGGEEHFQPYEAGVGDGNAEHDEDVGDLWRGGEFGGKAREDGIIGFGGVDSMSGALGAGVDANEGDLAAETRVDAARGDGDIGAGFGTHDERWVLALFTLRRGMVLED